LQSFDDNLAFLKLEEFRTTHGDLIKQNGNKLEADWRIHLTNNLDLFLRCGAGFTQFRHFKIKQKYYLEDSDGYADFLIDYISNTKY